MSRYKSPKLILLSSLMLTGCNGELGRKADVQQSLSAAPVSDSGQGTVGTPFERWQSCVKLLYSGASYSSVELREMFEVSGSKDQLLRRLKFISDKHLIMREELFDASVVEKLFTGLEVSPIEATSRGKAADVKLLAISADSGSPQAMAATVESRCVMLDLGKGKEFPTTSAEIYSSIVIDFGSDSMIQLGAVRSVFGAESELIPDRGISPHGSSYAPTYKGRVVYYGDAQSNEFRKVTFYLRMHQPETGVFRDEIGDEDVVARIEMNVEHAKKSRSP